MTEQTAVRANDLFRSAPEQELGHNLVEQAWAMMHQEAGDFQICVDNMKASYGMRRFIDKGEARMNYLEAQIGEMDCGAVDVIHPVWVDRHGPIRNRLVNGDRLDPKLLC